MYSKATTWRVLAASFILSLLATKATGAGVDRKQRDVAGDKPKVKYTTRSEQEELLTRLEYFGARNPDTAAAALTTEDQFTEAVKAFQRMANLPATGVVDEATIGMMNTPRCGVPDNPSMAAQVRRRKKRYVLFGTKWSSTDLTYRINTFTPDMKRRDVEDVIERAFDEWSSVSSLNFYEERRGDVDIDMLFGAGDHGDDLPFDGPSGTLAHAYYPGTFNRRGAIQGDVHFDEDETWADEEERGATSLYQVALHEIGHSLGLAHSNERNAVMYPYYAGFIDEYRLDTDDIEAIQRLYGARETTPRVTTPRLTTPTTTRATTTTEPTEKTVTETTTTAPTTTEDARSTVCDVTLDAITQEEDGSVYAFKGREVYKLDDSGVAAGFPLRPRDVYPGLPDDIDAALYWPRTTLWNNRYWKWYSTPARTYFFKGDKYWRYQNYKLLPNYPKDINRGFPGLPGDVDAAFVWSGNGRIYFIKGDKYYRYRRTQGTITGGVDRGYPRPLSVWKDVPETVDAVFRYKRQRNYQTYFFSDEQYYRFHDRDFKVDSSFPKDIAENWFGCRSSSNMEMAVLDPNDDGIDEVNPVGYDPSSGHSHHSNTLLLSLCGTFLWLLVAGRQ